MTLLRTGYPDLALLCGAALLAGVAAGCAGSEESSSAGGARDAALGDYKSAGGAPGGYDASISVDAGAEVTPPTPEQDDGSEFYKSPVATGRYVWVANPSSGRVAYVDSRTVTVRTVEVGAQPTYLAAVPTGDVVLVLNLDSQDATVLRADGSAAVTVPGMPPHANSWAVSPDGRWAVAYTDVRRVADLTAVSPLESFGETAVIDLAACPPAVTSFSAGYRPRQVVFSADLKRGFAVTEDGISVFSLPIVAARPIELVAVEVEEGEDPSRREVLITRDGSWALAHSEGSAKVVFVELSTGTALPVTLSGPVTDVALNSTGDRAVAVVKSTSEVAIMPVPGTATSGAGESTSSIMRMTLPDATVGRVVLAENNPDIAVLYTHPTTGPLVAEIAELHITQALYRSIKLAAGVDSVLLAPDGGHAVVLHKQVAYPEGGGAATMLYGFTVVPMDSTVPPSPHQTDAPLTAVAFGTAPAAGGAAGTGATRALLTVSDPVRHVQGMYLARFAAGTASRLALASPPIQVGIVDGASKAFVVQQHSEGRISMVDFGDEQAHTVTGFELSSAISNGN